GRADHPLRRRRAHGGAGGGGVPGGGAVPAGRRTGRRVERAGAGLAAGAARLAGAAGLRHPGHRRAAGDDAVAAGTGPATARVPRLAAPAAAADRTRIAAVRDHLGGLRAALGHPAHRGAVRARLLRPAPDPQAGAERAVLAGVRRPAAGPLAQLLARGYGVVSHPFGDGAAGAGVLRQAVRAGTAPAAGLTPRPRVQGSGATAPGISTPARSPIPAWRSALRF